MKNSVYNKLNTIGSVSAPMIIGSMHNNIVSYMCNI